MKKSDAPKHLSSEARDWWLKLTDEYGISDEAGRMLLQTGLEAFDRMRECQTAIKVDGPMIKDRFEQPKAHPLLSVERDARAQMLAALKALNLDLEPLRDGPGRPGGH